MTTASPTPVIQVRNLTKSFRYWVDRPTSLKSMMVDLLRGKLRFQRRQEFCALKDVNFDIFPGEFVGIMGKNGAGKSTLLKLISGIYTPTTGSVEVRGPIAPLLELGAGFHPDLSGYENIFLNAAILGFGRKATMDALPEILAFADIGDKIYMPVKNYSSGMLVRLGFSIATHLTAPVILVDEVLAVGDTGFQEKCLAKIQQLHKEGRTIVLVTHSPWAVENHCNRCIVIANQGKVYDGPAKEGVQEYLKAVH
jgi:ABC-type polysaccharide/polyol phosphate transport system ATPase subunit